MHVCVCVCNAIVTWACVLVIYADPHVGKSGVVVAAMCDHDGGIVSRQQCQCPSLLS